MTTHEDIHRDMGRMEGKQDAMGARLDKLERMVSEGFEKLDERLARIEARESERKGAWWTLGTICAAGSAFIAWLVSNFGGHS